MTPWLWTAIAITLDGAAALVGGILPETWLAKRRAALIGFAAGTLLVAALLEILPEAIEARGPEALWWCTGGFLAVALAEWSLHAHVHRRGPEAPAAVPPLTLLTSDALHNISDGIAIAAAFLISVPLGAITALAVIVHEVPEETGDYILLREAGVPKRRALLALAGVQATAALGAIGMLAAAGLATSIAGIALAIASGTFLFIAATDLLPEVLRKSADRRERIESVVGFGLGAATIALLAAW
jgi:zinc and cadmium transporter